MGLGVLDDHTLPNVPGTAIVLQGDGTQQQAPLDPNLKYDLSGPNPIVLVPQPSDDPNDPLNWPLWKRDVMLFCLSLLAVIASTLSPLLAANTLTVSLYFGRTFTDVALLTGWHLLGVGVGGLLFVPSARVWGKRHLYILGCVIVIFSSAWGGSTHECDGAMICLKRSNYISLTWARIFQGIGLAPFEALVNASVGDLYPVHQRGKRMAFTNLAVYGGAFLTPVIVGKMTHTIGWQWSFYMIAIFAGAMLPILIFFVPETAYRRDESLNIDTVTTAVNVDRSSTVPSAAHGEQNDATKEVVDSQQNNASTVHTQREVPQMKGWMPTLMPFNGRKTDESYLGLLLRPFPLFFHPTVFWACLIQGTLIGWTVMIGVVLAAIMLGPPLFFDEVQTGYMYTGAFVGAIVGFLISGLMSDSIPALMTKWNGGVYEPEFRLVLVIPQLVLGGIGLYGFGVYSDNTFKYGWLPADVFFGFEVAGMVVGAVASSLYIVDAHRDIAIEIFTCMMVFKNVFSFGLTWSAYQWLVDNGILKVFMPVATVQVIVCLLTIPMYVLGKKNRAFWARHRIFHQMSDAVGRFPGRLMGRKKTTPTKDSFQESPPATASPV